MNFFLPQLTCKSITWGLSKDAKPPPSVFGIFQEFLSPPLPKVTRVPINKNSKLPNAMKRLSI